MTKLEKLKAFVAIAPPGTMVPVAWLAKVLEVVEEGMPQRSRTADGLSLKDVGRELHAAEGTVRKYIREGKRGKSGRMILLRSFPGVGGQRVTEEALGEFIKELQRPAEPEVDPRLLGTPDMSIKERIALGKRISRAKRGGSSE